MVLMKMIDRSSCTCRSPRRWRYAKDIKKYRGKYLKGWDAIRAKRMRVSWRWGWSLTLAD